MSNARKPPTPGEIKGTLKGARRALKGRNASYDLERLLKNKKAVDILANAIVADELEVTPKQLGVVYQALANPTHRASLSSLAMFERGLESRSRAVRETSEAVMTAVKAESSGDAALARSILELAQRHAVRGALPMDARRWTAAELATELGVDETDIDAAVETSIATHDATRLLIARRHLDGRYSFSSPDVFECLRYPSPFEIERLVAAEDFKGLDGLLASAGIKRVAAERSAPKLTWRDGTRVTLAAQAWILTHTHTTGGFAQRTESDAQKAVRNALDLLRDTLSDESGRAFARWVGEFKGKNAPRCVVPGASAFDEVATLVATGTKVSAYVLDSLTGYPLGRRALLWAEVAFPKSRHPKRARFFGLCHDAWPSVEELGDRAERWRALADRFLAECVDVAHAFPWALFRRCYWDHSFMGPKVRAHALLCRGEPIAFDDAGEPVGEAPGSVTLATEAPDTPDNETDAEREARLEAAERKARARVPDFRRLSHFPESRFARALKPLGFSFVLESASLGTVYRDRMELRGVELRVAREGDGVRLTRISLVGAKTTHVEAGDGLTFVGAWANASEDQLALIEEALTALGLDG